MNESQKRSIPGIAIEGEVIATDKLVLRQRAARVANRAAGVKLYDVIVPTDQSFSGQPVADGTLRVLLGGSWIHREPVDASPFWEALRALDAAQNSEPTD